MINYDYLSCTDYNGTIKMLDMFPSELPSVKDTKLALASTDASDSKLVHVHKASANSTELVKGDGTGLTISALFLAMHPVGSIFMTTDSTNPGSTYGGTWVAWGAGRVPVGINSTDEDFSTVEQTGGSKTGVAAHTHALAFPETTAEAGKHDHAIDTYVAKDKTSIENAYAPWEDVVDAGTSSPELPYLVFGHDDNVRKVRLSGSYAYNPYDEYSVVSKLTTTFETVAAAAHTHNLNAPEATGSAGTENGNLQPYITCYMWKRIA